MIRLAAERFADYWLRPLALVDTPNRRGEGNSCAGIAEPMHWPEIAAGAPFFIKRQEQYFCRPAWNLFRNTPTLQRELRALEFAHAHAIPAPEVLAYGADESGRALLALAAIRPAHDLALALKDPGTDRAALLSEVGDVLAHMHALRVRHGALYPKHILVRADRPAGERVALIDFEKARRTLGVNGCMRADLTQLLRRSPFLTDSDRAQLAAAYARRNLSKGAQLLQHSCGKRKSITGAP